jgi:hypothetical protein
MESYYKGLLDGTIKPPHVIFASPIRRVAESLAPYLAAIEHATGEKPRVIIAEVGIVIRK